MLRSQCLHCGAVRLSKGIARAGQTYRSPVVTLLQFRGNSVGNGLQGIDPRGPFRLMTGPYARRVLFLVNLSIDDGSDIPASATPFRNAETSSWKVQQS